MKFIETLMPLAFKKNGNSNKSKEVFCVTECDYSKLMQHPRPGLEMVKYLYDELPQVKAKFSSPSPELKHLVNMWKTLLTRHGSVKNPWKLASQWGRSQSLVEKGRNGLANILYSMRTSDIVHSDIGYKGTQLKISLVLKGGQSVVFKPERSENLNTRSGMVYEGADRHYGEIASFHLSLLLNMTTVPLVVGRRLSLRKEVFPVASRALARTFILRGRRTCLYGDCLYCRIGDPVCDDGHHLAGAAILWLDDDLDLSHRKHPWARLYDHKDRLAEWETNREFCLKLNSSLSKKDSPLLLNLVDVSVFDFLIQNGDRHHYSVAPKDPNSPIYILDNGKGFGNPYRDHLDILAPLLQCCRIRRRTYERLILLSGGGLSGALDDLLYTDGSYPVLAKSHLRALDRRIYFVLAAIKLCQRTNGNSIFS